MKSVKQRWLFRGRAGGFTLVELLTVVAILGILGMVAVPAYNSYSLKSKFSEVVLASAPTKTAVSACAVAGDCVSGAGDAAHIDLTGATSTISVCTSSPQQVCSTTYNQVLVGTPGFYSSGSGCYNRTTYTYSPGLYPCDITYSYVTQPTTTCATQSVTTCSPSQAAALKALPCVGGPSCNAPTKYVASVSYDFSGVITATAVSSSQGLNGETFILTPSYAGGRVDWSASGSCKTRGGGALC